MDEFARRWNWKGTVAKYGGFCWAMQGTSRLAVSLISSWCSQKEMGRKIIIIIWFGALKIYSLLLNINICWSLCWILISSSNNTHFWFDWLHWLLRWDLKSCLGGGNLSFIFDDAFIQKRGTELNSFNRTNQKNSHFQNID